MNVLKLITIHSQIQCIILHKNMYIFDSNSVLNHSDKLTHHLLLLLNNHHGL